MFLIWTVLILICLAFETDSESDEEIVKCNPLIDEHCYVTNEGLHSSIHESFFQGTKYFSISNCRKGVLFNEEGLKLTIKNEYDNPVLASSFYIMYGKVEAEIKGGSGQGIISSFYLQSDDLDEIDICELFGSDEYEFQTNYFIKGNISNYERGRYHHLSNNPLKDYNRYGVEWTPEWIVWYLNDKIVRKLSCKNKYGFPSSPLLVKFSLWSGGDDSNTFGTIAWAGGETNYNQGPFNMYIRNLNAIDYSTGHSYTYGWLPNGEWQELESREGDIYGDAEKKSNEESSIWGQKYSSKIKDKMKKFKIFDDDKK